MGYAEFLVEKLVNPSLHPYAAYGCLISLKNFGEHITSTVVCPKIEMILKMFDNWQNAS